MSIHHVTVQNFREEVLSSEKPVLLDFWAPWCGPCRMVSPILEEIARENPDLKVCKVNIDEEYDLAVQYRIVSIPTLLLLRNGHAEGKIVGCRPRDQLLEWIGKA